MQHEYHTADAGIQPAPTVLTDRYLGLIAAGRPRYSIDGANLGVATDAHRAAAVLVLAHRAEPRWRCRKCGAWAGVIGPGTAPHWEVLRCAGAGAHFVAWLPKPAWAKRRRASDLSRGLALGLPR